MKEDTSLVQSMDGDVLNQLRSMHKKGITVTQQIDLVYRVMRANRNGTIFQKKCTCSDKVSI